MASEDSNAQTNGSSNASTDPSSDPKSLEGFIASQIAEQSINRGESPGENIDEEKMNRFMSRAISESRRMNMEVEKSHAKMNKLHEELGAERLTAWRQEHSAEVLTHQQARLVEAAQAKP